MSGRQSKMSRQGATESGTPKYEKLRAHLIDLIVSGNLKPGEMIPTEQQLADQFTIARSTVRQAMTTLVRDGLVRRTQGKGTFVHEDALQRLKSGLDVFALVLPETQTGYYPSLQQSFEEASSRMHQQMLVCCTHNDIDKQGNIILQLIDKRVAGVAIVPITAALTPPYQIRQLQKAGIPVVFCHRRVEGCEAPLLAIPFEKVGRLAGRKLAQKGHRIVAFFSPRYSRAFEEYVKGLRAELKEHGGKLPDEFCHLGATGLPSGQVREDDVLPALEAICMHKNRPTAILTSFDTVAEMIYLLLGRLGISVPGEMSVMGFGGTIRRGALQQMITSVTIDEVQLGCQAADLLDQMRRGALPLDHNETREMTLGFSQGSSLGMLQSKHAKKTLITTQKQG